MANNCVVTKLQSSVNNNNLPVLNGIIVRVYADETPDYSKRRIGFLLGTTTTFKVLSGDVYFTDSTGSQNLGTEISRNQGSQNIYLSNHNGIVSIVDKANVYNINCTSGSSEFIAIDISQLSYSANNGAYNYLSIVEMNKKLYGNVSDLNINNRLADFRVSQSRGLYGSIREDIQLGGTINVSYTTIGLKASQIGSSTCTSLSVSGDINAIGDCADLACATIKNVFAESSGISGELEGFFAGIWNAGRRDSTVSFRASTRCSFNGTHPSGLTTYSGAYSSSGITVSVGGTTIGTYNGSTWTYNS